MATRYQKSLRMNALMATILAIADAAGGRLPTARRSKDTNNWPHNGARECARRRGNPDWRQFRADDRVRRGLPAWR